MKKADNFDASKWLIENKITTQSRLNEEENVDISKFLKEFFVEFYLEGGEEFKNKPGEIEKVTFKGEEYLDTEEYEETASQFKLALEYLKKGPISIEVEDYGKVSVEKIGKNIIYKFTVPEFEENITSDSTPIEKFIEGVGFNPDYIKWETAVKTGDISGFIKALANYYVEKENKNPENPFVGVFTQSNFLKAAKEAQLSKEITADILNMDEIRNLERG
jgi:hypothetical protein